MDANLAELIEKDENALSVDEKRFLLDLEFVQCLANPSYLKYISQHEAKYFADERFVAYLKYLLYFKDPEYNLLQDETFRSHLPTAPILADAIAEQQRLHWDFYNQHRISNPASKDIEMV